MTTLCELQDKSASAEHIRSLQAHLEQTSSSVLTELILLASLAALCCRHHTIHAPSADGSNSAPMPSSITEAPSAGAILTALLQIHINGLAVVPQRHSHAKDRIALAVYPTASLINHSCQPNVALAFDGTELTARAIQPLQAGQAVLHCYGPQKGELVTPLRRQQLQEQYHFLCQCPSCVRGFDSAEQAMVGLQCLDSGCDGVVVPQQAVAAGLCSVHDLPGNTGSNSCSRWAAFCSTATASSSHHAALPFVLE